MIGKDLVEGTLSARNILAGKITNLHPGAVNSEIEVTLQGGAIVIATITNESVKTLGLVVEDKVSAIVKASNVLIGV
jgi:molybdate transport system regulatory protein